MLILFHEFPFSCDRFEVAVKFAIPNIIIEPTLDSVKTALTRIADAILQASDKAVWWAGERGGETFLLDIQQEVAVNSTVKQLKRVVNGKNDVGCSSL